MLFNRPPVPERAIPLMNFKPVMRVFFRQSHHKAVTGYFRNDGCDGNSGNLLITTDYRGRGYSQIAYAD